jgi:hypothetical protein
MAYATESVKQQRKNQEFYPHTSGIVFAFSYKFFRFNVIHLPKWHNKPKIRN